MPIKVDCPSCGHHYQVGDALAGKKVKCKACGAVIAIPNPGSEEDFDFSAIDVEPEKPSGKSAAGVQVEQPRYEQPYEEDEPAPGDEPLPEYNFSGAPILETLIPAVLGTGCLGWMAVQAFRADDPNHGWVGPFRAAMYLFTYAAIVFPITLIGVRAVGHRAYVAMPANYKWKAFGVFSVPAALAAIFTLLSPGLTMLVVGIVVGLLVSMGAFIFLFGIRPQQMGTAIGTVSGYLIGGTVVGIGLLVGVGFILQAVLGLAKTGHEYPMNPVGPQFTWNPPPGPADNGKPKKQTIVEVPTTESATQPTENATTNPTTNPVAVTPTTNPTTQVSTTGPSTRPAETQPVVVHHELSPLLVAEPTELPVDSFVDVTFGPPNTTSAVLVQTAHADFGDTFELWHANGGEWTKGITFTLQPKTTNNTRIILNARGSAFARMIDFPRVCVEFRPLTNETVAGDNANAKKADPDLTRGGAWEPLAFTTPSYILMVNRAGGSPVADVLDPLALPGAQHIGRPIGLEGMPPNAKCDLVLSPDARYLASVRYNQNPIPIAPQQGNYLTINSLVVSAVDPLKVGLTDLKPTEPIAVTGLCYWPDGSRVSLLFQDKGNFLIETYQSPTAKRIKSLPSAGPAGEPLKDFRGSALTVIANGTAFLINGRYVFDSESFEPLGDLGIEDVQEVHLVDRDTLQMLVKSGTKSKVLLAKLDSSKFRAVASKPAIPRPH